MMSRMSRMPGETIVTLASEPAGKPERLSHWPLSRIWLASRVGSTRALKKSPNSSTVRRRVVIEVRSWEWGVRGDQALGRIRSAMLKLGMMRALPK